MENSSGKFIVIDGTDGSGKTTQLNLLKEKLEYEGYTVEVADFPQYNTKSAGLVEEYLSGKYGQADEVDPYKASIFYAVDRFDASPKIKQWLQEGKVVLANRYTSASLGHQGCKIDNPLERKVFFNWLYDLEYKIFEIPKPDLTIILQVEPEISFTLAKDRAREDWKGKTTDIHENNFEHLKKAEQTYLEIANNLPGFRLIKCTHNNQILSREAIHFLVWLATSQIVIHQAKQRTGFEQIGSLIGSNAQIMKNRDLIFNNNNNKSEVALPTLPTLNNQSIQAPQVPSSPIAETPSIAEIKPAPHSIDQNVQVTAPVVPAAAPIQLTAEKISIEAKLPQKAHEGDAGYDLYANDYYSITAYGQALVSTGIKLAIPVGYVGLIWDKSGLANEGITTMGGVIDSNYRGEIKVIIKNLSEDIFNIVPGQKIAQIIIQKFADLNLEERKIEDTTNRQNQGFGSSGKF
jgi:dTMP kinase